MVAFRAGVGVVTGHGIVGKNAPAIRVAGVVGTEIGVIANEFGAGNTGPVGAQVVVCARIAVVTGGGVVDGATTVLCITEVIGTRVVVCAVNGRSRSAPAIVALVILGADVLIITRGTVEDELTTGVDIAGIIGTQVVVIAGQGARRDAFTEMALVPGGAHVLVVARGLIHEVDATGLGLA